MRRRHVLHVGSGYRPLRWGGLVAYVQDLTVGQARRGDRVTYLFSGRYFRWPAGPRLKRWSLNGVEMLEIINSPLYDHGRQPELELAEPRLERLFDRLLCELRPDVLHVQELAGVPSSILEIARRAGVPVVMTLQDYFPLCSTFKLLDADGQVCRRREIGADCVATVRAEGRPANLLFDGTMRFELERRWPLKGMHHERREAVAEWFGTSWLTRLPGWAERGAADAADFQRRRTVNRERLNRVDRLIAMSRRVAEIYADLGVAEDRLTTMPLTLAHIEALTPRRPSGRGPLTFATVGGGESVAKGSRVLLQAARRLAREADPKRYRLLVFGRYDPVLRAAVEEMASVELAGGYLPSEQDAVLDQVDVGVMPSIWEEAYGYAGIEFIAKGIPVVANRLGGMPEYVRDGETGWLNRSSSGRELAEMMLGLIAAPERVVEVARRTRAARDELVTSMDDHLDAVQRVYDEVSARRPRA